jgi:hypothetical protein
MRTHPRYLLVLSVAVLLLAHSASAAPQAKKTIPSPIKTVYVCATSHWDIGFTDPVDVVLERTQGHLAEVVNACRDNPELRWAVEASWQVTEWMDRCPDPALVEEFFRLVRAGRITLGAAYAMAPGYAGEAMNRLVYPTEKLRRRFQVETPVCLENDFNVLAWALPSVLADSGVKYLLNGYHVAFGQGMSIPPGQQPFWWEGPDGKRVLVWCTPYTGAIEPYYIQVALARFFGVRDEKLRALSDLELMEHGIRTLLKQYEDSGYDRDAVLTIIAHDNVGPGTPLQMMRYLKLWNDNFDSPKIEFVSPEVFFRHMEEKYGSSLPVFRGEWVAWGGWFVYNGGDSGPVRAMLSRLPSTEKLASISKLLGVARARGAPLYPAEDINKAYYEHILYSGHGGGCWNCPKADIDHASHVHATHGANLAELIEFRERYALQGILSKIASPQRSIVVFNSLSWPRTDPVLAELPESFFDKPFRLTDPSGAEVAYELAGPRQIRFLASVPSLGFACYTVAEGKPSSSPELRSSSASFLETDFYRVELDQRRLAFKSIRDKQAGRELVDLSSSFPFATVYTQSPEDAKAGRATPSPASKGSIRLEVGPVSLALVIQRPGTFNPTTTLRAYRRLKRIDVANIFDESRADPVLAQGAMTNYGVSFPFALDRSRLTAHYETTHAFLRDPDDYLPSVSPGLASHYAERAFDLRQGPSGFGLTVAPILSGTVAYPAPPITAEKLPPVKEWAVLSPVYRGYRWAPSGDFGAVPTPPADPIYPFLDIFTSGLGPFDAVATPRFGWQAHTPLLAGHLAGSGVPGAAPAPASVSFFALDAPNVELLTVKQADFGSEEDTVLRFREFAGKPTDVTLGSAFPIEWARLTNRVEADAELPPLAITRVEDSALPHRLHFTIGPNQVLTIRARIEAQPSLPAPPAHRDDFGA